MGTHTLLATVVDELRERPRPFRFVNVSTDVVTENVNEGTDTVQSSVTYTLGNNVEGSRADRVDIIPQKS